MITRTKLIQITFTLFLAALSPVAFSASIFNVNPYNPDRYDKANPSSNPGCQFDPGGVTGPTEWMCKKDSTITSTNISQCKLVAGDSSYQLSWTSFRRSPGCWGDGGASLAYCDGQWDVSHDGSKATCR